MGKDKHKCCCKEKNVKSIVALKRNVITKSIMIILVEVHVSLDVVVNVGAIARWFISKNAMDVADSFLNVNVDIALNLYVIVSVIVATKESAVA